jgi:hypothetical protein
MIEVAAHEPAAAHLTRPARPLLRREAACSYLQDVWGIHRRPATLAKLACLGGGPRFHRAGRWPLYSPDDLDTWARKLIGEPMCSTSEAA